ncbi:hypothetical protein KJN74_05380 [Candidatus Bathyarchaeota archaeon]|nr:hypothetical protein [Candidatus Bathyarchaeota archaeon]
MILLTTSRRPTERIRTFCRDFVHSIPFVIRINRGKISNDGLAEKAIELEADRVIIVNRWQDGFAKINLFQVSSTGLKPVFPLILISRICLRREIEKGTKRKFSSIITVESSTPELDKLSKSMSNFLDLPIMTIDEAVKKNLVSMHFSIDYKNHLQANFILSNQMVEIGPKLILSRLIWTDS